MKTLFAKIAGIIAGVPVLLGLTAPQQAVPEKLDLYLLIGQSNMAGRGIMDATSQPANPLIWVINSKDEWVEARDPLHFDKPAVTGVGPGLAFAQEIVKQNPNQPIGLIPCAVGGSGIDDWKAGQKHAQTGIYPYDAMLKRVREAQKKGVIKAILWHQGESDSVPKKSDVYEEKLTAFFQTLRKDIGAPETPVLLGTLGDFYVAKKPEGLKINGIISHFPEKHKNFYVVSAAGLIHLGDSTHFNTTSAQELGRRYAEVLLKIR